MEKEHNNAGRWEDCWCYEDEKRLTIAKALAKAKTLIDDPEVIDQIDRAIVLLAED